LVVEQVIFIATTGWTTDELIKGMDDAKIDDQRFDLVSLSIGVNNQYRGRDTAEYRIQLKELIDRALVLAENKTERLFLMSIPDWGVTPFATNNGRNAEQVGKEIDQFNQIMKEEAALYGLYYEDINPISKEAASNSALVANDGLHPSGEMYTLWVKQLMENHGSKLVQYLQQ
jgi:lysophospholipase L1-like esterase